MEHYEPNIKMDIDHGHHARGPYSGILSPPANDLYPGNDRGFVFLRGTGGLSCVKLACQLGPGEDNKIICGEYPFRGLLIIDTEARA